MRYLLSLLVLPVMALELSSGNYLPYQSNDDSICPQKIRAEKSEETTFLKVVYVGDCYYQGPYTYYCVENVCTDGHIDYHIEGKDSFYWINKNYRIWGKFKKE